MNYIRNVLAVALVSGFFLLSTAMGAITYIDAELGNTTVNGEALSKGVNYSTSYADIDNLWGWRTNRTDVNGAGVWVSDGGSDGSVSDRENTEPLKINISLPQPGIYKLYAIIMNNNSGSGHWDVAARIGDSGYFSSYNKYNDAVSKAIASDFIGTVKVSGSGDMTFKVMIGTYSAHTANEIVSIYINGLDGWDTQTGLDQRTRFDGLGYEKVSDLQPFAQNVFPADGTNDVLSVNPVLQWLAGNDAAGHNVYLSTDMDSVEFRSDINASTVVDMADLALLASDWQKSSALASGSSDLDQSGTIDIGDLSVLAVDWLASAGITLKGSFPLATNTFDAGLLSPDQTYYWRIDEVGSQDITKGDIWEFKTFKGDGLTAYIYDDMYLSDLKVTRVDSRVSFNWAQGSPDPSVDSETFSIAWKGGVIVPEEGEYTFYTNSDDGLRLYVNDLLIIDHWSGQSLTEHSGNVFLRPGTVYPIRLEYYDNTGSAAMYLSWSGPGITKQIIPSEYLASTVAEVRPNDMWVIDLGSMPTAMRFTALTLQGLVAKDKPEILVKQGGLTSYIRTQMEQEGTVFHDNTSVWWLLNKYRDYIDGIVVCSSDLNSINCATSLCGPMRAIGVYASNLEAVQARTGLPVLADVQGLSEADIFETYKDLFDKEVLVDVNKIDFLRDISITRNAFTFYNVESAARRQYIADLTSQGLVLGWGSNAEYNWIKDVSSANAAGVPADWCKNLSTLSKLKTSIPKPPRRYPEPVKDGERIIAFSMSDGDNLQIMAGGAINDNIFFGNEHRGSFPMSWEFPPSMGYFVPRGVRSFYGEATTGENLDCFIAGPSGAGYAFHCYMPGSHTFAKNTGQSMKLCGLTVASLINDNSGSMADTDQFLERPEIMGVVYKDWVPYNRRNGAIYWHNGKPCVSYKFLLWGGTVGDPSNLGDWETVSEGIAAMPSSPATDQGSYALINANAWSFGDYGGPMQAIVNTIELLPENTRLVTVEELIILLRNNFGDSITEEEYLGM